MNKQEIIFSIISFFVGSTMGFFVCSLVASNSIKKSWHNGFRAGKYSKD